jgi:MFS family permease
MIRAHLVDTRPLRTSRPFRAFWAGTAVSQFGGSMSSFALLYYVWDISRSAVVVGLVGLVVAVPLVVCGLIGGHLADTVDRRALLLWSRSAQLVVGAGTAALVIAGVRSIPVVFVMIGLTSALSSLSAPVAQTVPPMLLSGTDLAAGLALTRLAGQLALLTGPAIGGVLIATVGVGACLVIDMATFGAALWGIALLPRHAPRGAAARAERPRLLGGLRFVVRTPVILGAFLVDICAMVLALPAALFPVINAERFGGSPITLGLMLPAIGLGGVIAGLLSGRLTAYPRQGLIMLTSCAVWGAATAAFGASPTLPLALASLVVAGAADTFTVVSRGTIVQTATPDELRGRVSSLDYLVGAGGPSLGDLRAGVIAGATSGAVSCIVGGLACVAGAGAIAAAGPRLRRWRLGAPVEGRGEIAAEPAT